jgi:hypothetical protein
MSELPAHRGWETPPTSAIKRAFAESPLSGLWPVVLGCAVGFFAALALYATKPVYLGLLVAGVAVVIPTFLVKDYRLYWLGLFLFVLQFDFKKNLNDGLAIVDQFQIDYALYNFTFELRASDLVFILLAFFWINDLVYGKRRATAPRAAWLAVAYLAVCFASLFQAPWPYLGVVELVRQMRFFVFFLYAYNNLRSKQVLRMIAVIAVAMLVIQGAVTAGRYVFGFYEPIAFGQTYFDEGERDRYLAVDSSSGKTERRAFGTMTSPGSTGKFCLMLIPFGLMLCLRNPLLGSRGVFIVLLTASLGALTLTYTRSFFLAAGVELLIGFLIAVRRGYLHRQETLGIIALVLLAGAYVAPKVQEMFQYRKSSYTVRLRQYESALRQIEAHPLLGVGLNNGTGVKPDYVDVSYNAADPDTQSHSEPTHNLYLGLSADIGLIGSFCFFMFFGLASRAAFRVGKSRADPERAFVGNVIVVVYAGVAMTAMGDPLHEDAVVTLLWMYAGIAFALRDSVRAPAATAATPRRALELRRPPLALAGPSHRPES